MIQRALISVSNKDNIINLAKELHQLNIELISTGGTYKTIHQENIPVIPVEKYTGAPEILGGRVKTLHPKIHGGILARRDNNDHITELQNHDMKPIDMVVVNLYPFEQVIKKKDVSPQEVIENIDIGGITLLRAAAKNYQDVVIITDPQDYDGIITELKNEKNILEKTRFQLALKAFKMTSNYDMTIDQFLNDKNFLFLS